MSTSQSTIRKSTSKTIIKPLPINPPAISLFSSVHAQECQPCPLDLYLSQVQSGQWQPLVEAFRQHPENAELRQSLPVVALAGAFDVDKDGLSLARHSGFLALDLDGFADRERGKSVLAQDRYTYAVFENSSAHALTVLVRIAGSGIAGSGIAGNAHSQAFEALSEYYEAVYGLVNDPADQLVTRLRFVSYDPFLCGNPEAQLFRVHA